ncbi:MAG TPA: prohibitin family protein [Oceanospirillales bacterium]|nr:prohibitin family protein [Oceanospirillales bacterium]
MNNVRQIQPRQEFPIKTVILVVVVLLLLMFGSKLYKTVPVGHVAVATLFGKVVDTQYPEGLHVPVNPLYKWHEFDVREKTHKETAEVPSQDQLQTRIDVSIQYRLNAAKASDMLQTTGNMEDLLEVQLIPKLRSLLREQGKTIKRAEDFFLEETQNKLQVAILTGLQEYLAPKGVEVSAVLIRDITLPQFITKAIESKKEREQAVEKQKAELERFRTEKQQLLVQAEAQRKAAEQEAAQKRILADAQAYEIKKINEAVGNNPNYIKLMSLEALKAISKDPASKIYFMDSNSPQPLPLMHLSDKK